MTPPRGERYFDADWDIVSPGYLGMMKIALVAGRDFNGGDRKASPFVMIVNETAARRWWPGQSPLGKTILQQDGVPGQRDRMRPLTIIGVAHDSKYRNLGEEPRAFVYVPYSQQYISRATIMARAAGRSRLAPRLRSLVAERHRNLPIVSAQSFDDYASVALVPQRLAAAIAGSLGVVGLLLAAMGIYGVTALMVSSRTREIGIRMALGARRANVVRMVLRQGTTLALAGVVLGLAIAAGVSRFLGSLLLGLDPADPITFAGAAALFCIVGLAACYIPVRRATEIEPVEALRCD
jgi:predicted permease